MANPTLGRILDPDAIRGRVLTHLANIVRVLQETAEELHATRGEVDGAREQGPAAVAAWADMNADRLSALAFELEAAAEVLDLAQSNMIAGDLVRHLPEQPAAE